MNKINLITNTTSWTNAGKNNILKKNSYEKYLKYMKILIVTIYGM